MLGKKLQADQLAALKSGDKSKLDTLRFVLSRVKNKEIEKKDDLNDEEVIQILKKTAKELKESLEMYEKAGRQELVDEHAKQLAVVEAYLPAELSDEVLSKEIEALLAQNETVIKENPKAIIGIVMKELRSKADPGRIMKLLQEKI